jgi:iron complex transport system substrate-binding protein
MIKGILITALVFLSISGFAQTRIVTAGSVVTETVCALGDCDLIVASDRTSLYPPHIQALPSIGYRSGINAEGILSLKPTLVIVEKDYVDASVVSQLSSAQVPVVLIEQLFSLDGTKAIIKTIANALHRKSEGEQLIIRIEKDLVEAQGWVKKSKSTPKVLCVHNRGVSLVNLAGEKTFSEILPFAGAVNAIQDVKGFKALNSEALIAANPDYILFFDTGMESLGGIEGALKIQGVALTTAGKRKQLIEIESTKLANFGPRFGEAVKELTLLLHPDIKR